MDIVTLMYHDVVERDRFDDSGFLGTGANRYKVDRKNFIDHLAVFRNAGLSTVAPVATDRGQSARFRLTFDDGGASSLDTADILEDYGFRGHFFVPTDCIGKPRFIMRQDLVSLVTRGHILGSHSKSHPASMSHLSESQMIREWSESIDTLSQIIGHPVLTASVPNGRYSRTVATCASNVGIQHLFTSEPQVCCQTVDRCGVSGRFTILGNTTSKDALDLVLGTGFARTRQFVSWNARKCLKYTGGSLYDRTRRFLLHPSRRLQ